MAGSVHIPWYATGFRADSLEAALEQIAPLALRYGATGYAVYRSRDDRFRFVQTADFEDKIAWERYWSGREFVQWRTLHSGWFQVPALYVWHDIVTRGALRPEPVPVAE